VDKIHELKSEIGMTHAATLLIVSGKNHQEAVKQLSQHQVGLPPLANSELAAACKAAFKHVGPSRCYASCINGGGKTHAIMRQCAERQCHGQKEEAVAYARIPLRESTTAETLVSMLTKARNKFSRQQGKSIAYHLDISHIIPVAANTMLFELLILGLVRDPVNQTTFQRRKIDTFDIEIPNSVNDKTAQALYITSYIPKVVLECKADCFDFEVPVLSSRTGEIQLHAYTEVCVGSIEKKRKTKNGKKARERESLFSSPHT
jgi:hypothetical protein